MSSSNNGFHRWLEAGKDNVPPTDTRIVTSDGQTIQAHSVVLASASPVLERLLERARLDRDGEKTIRILGASYESVLTFVHFLYSSRDASSKREMEVAMENHGMALLAMSHAYRIWWLKAVSESGVGRRLSAANVVDAVKMSKLCDAPRLYQRCMRVVTMDFAAVQESEGWRFLQKHDPAMEVEIVRFLQEKEQRRKRWKRERTDQELYKQLSDSMDCLQHIFTEGCTTVGPQDSYSPSNERGPCTSFSTCKALQQLIIHSTICNKKSTTKGCPNCKRLSQIFRLHSSICDQSDSCNVPLCKQFKMKMQIQTDKKVDQTWTLLVKKVVAAKFMASLANRKRAELVDKSWSKYRVSSSHT